MGRYPRRKMNQVGWLILGILSISCMNKIETPTTMRLGSISQVLLFRKLADESLSRSILYVKLRLNQPISTFTLLLAAFPTQSKT